MDHYYTYRGDLRAAVGVGANLWFVTTHPEGQPTAVYRIDTGTDSLADHALPCGAVAVVAVGETILAAGTDNRLHAVSGKTTKPVAGPFDAPPVALVPVSGDRLAVVAGRSLLIVAREGGAVLQTLALGEAGTCVAADPSGQWLAVGGDKGSVSVFDGQDKPEFEPADAGKLHDGAVAAILFEPEELRFFSVGADNKLLTTHARGTLEPEDKGRGNGHTDAVTALLYLPTGDRLVTGSRDKSVKNWPRAGAIKPGTVTDSVGRVVALALVAPHGSFVAVLSDDATIAFLPVGDDGRFEEDADVETAGGAMAWAAQELSVGWDGKRREQALKVLAGWNDTPSLDLIAAQAGTDGDSAVRAAAAKLLGKSPNPRAVTLLEPLVNHGDDKVRVAAFEGLQARLGATNPRPIDLALDTGKADVGVLAVAALEPLARADDQALAKLVAALAAPAWDVRRRAVAALEAVYDGDPARATLTAVNAGHGDVRALALRRSFERKLLGQPAVLAAVRRRLEDDDAAVRQVAFLLLVQARPALLAALRARDPELNRQLGELEKSEAKPKPASGPATGLDDADMDVLLQAASSRALDTCLRGATGLARLADPRAFPLLLQLSREEPEYARVEVCRALAALGDGRATARLRSMLGDPQPSVRDAAYTAVAQLSSAEPLSAAEAGLTAAHEDVRRRGLQTLLTVTKAKPPQDEGGAGWGLFVRALNDPAPSVRREAFKAALNQNVAGGGERSLRFALRSVHPDVRREVLTEVQAQAGEPWATALVFEFFNDPAPELRAEAFELATKKVKELAPLEAALGSKYPDARVLAVDALFKKHSKAAQAVLLRATADPDPGVRQRAVSALVDDDARDALAQSLDADHADVRVRAAAALARFGDPAALPVLRAAAFAPEPVEDYKREGWRSVAADALAGLRSLADESVFPDLVALLDSPHAALRARAAAALVTCTPAAGVESVRRVLAHADPAVRTQAAQALAARGDATVHPLLSGEGADAVNGFTRLAALVAAEPLNTGALAVTLDTEDDAARRAALVVHLLLERAGTDGVPDLLLQALSARAPRVRLAAALGLEQFSDPAGFAAFVAKQANDRGDEPAWKLAPEVLDQLAAVLAFAVPARRFEAAGLLAHLADKEGNRFLEAWTVFTKRHAADVSAAVAGMKLVVAKLSASELRELAFGAYVGLVREQGSGSAGGAVVRVRQTALARVAAIAAGDKQYARAARPVFTQALGDPNAPVRAQAFDHLQALGLPKTELGAEALEAGHTDLGVRGLELLTDGTSSKDGQAVLERVMLSRTDDLATEAAKLLAKPRGVVPVAVKALEAVSESLRDQAVAWLAEAFDADDAAKDGLRGAVASRYRRVRERAAFALARKKDPAAFDTLATLLREATDERRQGELIAAFAELGDPRAVGALLDRIETDPTGTAATDELFSAAGAFRHPESADRLLAMGAGRKGWRAAAFDAVQVVSGFDQHAPEPGRDPAAFEKAEREQHPRRPAVLARLIEAVLAAGEVDDWQHLPDWARVARGADVDPPLATLCGNADEYARHSAVEAVGWRAKHRGGPVDPLLKALRHKDPTTQFIAAEGLARVGRPEGLTVLLSGLEYIDDVNLRARAVLALGELADPRAVDALLKLAVEAGHALQESAAEAIGHLRRAARAEEVGKLLERLARSTPDGVARRALVGLRHFDSAAGWRVIRANLKHASWQTRQVAAEQLGYDKDLATAPLLLDLLRKERDTDVLGAALDAALKLLGPDSLEPFYAAVENDSAAEESLGASQHFPVDVVCDKGDALRMLDLFPRCVEEVQERLEASLSGRSTVPVKEATAALGHADSATVRLAARLLTSGPPATAEVRKALAGAVTTWRTKWAEARAAVDRGGDRALLDGPAACLQALLWASARLGAAGDDALELALARPDDPLAKALRLDALRTLASLSPLPKTAPAALEKLAADADAEVRTLAAAVLAVADPKRAAGLLAGQLSDKPTFARAVASGVEPGEVTRAAAGKPHQQSVALPALVRAKDFPALAAVANDRKAPEPARLGAVEGLGFMADAAAEAELKALATATGDDEDVRKAAWKALRRSRRARAKRELQATPAGAGE